MPHQCDEMLADARADATGQRVAVILSALSFLWACAATTFILGGVGQGGVITRFELTGDPAQLGRVGMSLVSTSGVWMMGLLSSVALLAGIPLGVALRYPKAHWGTAWGAASLLLGFSMATGFTVGLFYAPCAGASLAAAALAAPPAGGPRGTLA